MRIGIDIDDTITNTWNDIIPYYSLWFDIPIEKLKSGKPYYEPIKHRYTVDQFFKEIVPIYEGIIPYVSLKDNVKEILDDLHRLGHKIIFISSRGRGYIDPYSLTKEYLDRNSVYYDKIIVNAEDKYKVCMKEKIDLFIDDSYKHCREVSNLGIKVIMADNYFNKEFSEFDRLDDWKQIYKYIEK